MGSKGLFCLALCFVACGESGSSRQLVGVGVAGSFPATGGLSAGGTPTGGAPNGAGGATTLRCQSDRDCTPFRLLCDHARSVCVECLIDFDCATGERCRVGVCQAPITCSNSLDCVDAPNGRVICDQTASNCVECVTNADCAAGVCENTRCMTTTTGSGGASDGGAAGTGGSLDTGGFTASGGSTSDTGGSTNVTGGSPGTGGAPDTGGVASTGGWWNAGGYGALGGFPGAGGRMNTGGFTYSGGFTSTGGRVGAGGTAGAGGAASCVAAQCPACTVSTSGKCCTAQGQCGCDTFYVPGTCTAN